MKWRWYRQGNWCTSHAWYLIPDAFLRCTYRNRINYLWLKFVKIKSLQNTSGKVINHRNNKSINDSNEAQISTSGKCAGMIINQWTCAKLFFTKWHEIPAGIAEIATPLFSVRLLSSEWNSNVLNTAQYNPYAVYYIFGNYIWHIMQLACYVRTEPRVFRSCM